MAMNTLSILKERKQNDLYVRLHSHLPSHLTKPLKMNRNEASNPVSFTDIFEMVNGFDTIYSHIIHCNKNSNLSM